MSEALGESESEAARCRLISERRACRGDAVVVAVVRAVQPRTAKERHHNLARVRLRVTTRVWVRASTT